MKNYYTLVCFTLISIIGFAQNYEFGLVHISGYDFKVIATPDFDSSTFAPGPNFDTDVSDVGFTLVLPAGTSNIINEVSLLSGRTWTVDEFDAAFLTGEGLGDGTKDTFQFNMPPGQSEFPHTAGQNIDLVSFSVSNMPTTDNLYFLLNSDPIAAGAGGVLNSFYNVDIDGAGAGAGTTDYFSGIAAGMDSFSFSTLSTNTFSQLEYSISIYPNPTSEYITITSSLELTKVELFDLLGKRVLDTAETAQIKVNHLPTGMYVIKVHATNGTLTKKIMIE